MDEDDSAKEPEEQLIADRAGRTYRLTIAEVRNFWFLKIYDGRLRVGEAKCHQKIDELLLGDVCVVDQVTQHDDEGIGRIFRPVFEPQQRAVNYRGRGLGSSLLEFIIARAAERGLPQITGNLFPRDLKANPKLPDWYRRFGFEVTMRNSESGSIRLRLPLPT